MSTSYLFDSDTNKYRPVCDYVTHTHTHTQQFLYTPFQLTAISTHHPLFQLTPILAHTPQPPFLHTPNTHSCTHTHTPNTHTSCTPPTHILLAHPLSNNPHSCTHTPNTHTSCTPSSPSRGGADKNTPPRRGLQNTSTTTNTLLQHNDINTHTRTHARTHARTPSIT
jgi:hypothetical protein